MNLGHKHQLSGCLASDNQPTSSVESRLWSDQNSPTRSEGSAGLLCGTQRGVMWCRIISAVIECNWTLTEYNLSKCDCRMFRSRPTSWWWWNSDLDWALSLLQLLYMNPTEGLFVCPELQTGPGLWNHDERKRSAQQRARLRNVYEKKTFCPWQKNSRE